MCRQDSASHFERLIASEFVSGLALAMGTLSEKERLVMALCYYKKLTLNGIGFVLKVSESRVCQIHAKAVSGLKPKVLKDVG